MGPLDEQAAWTLVRASLPSVAVRTVPRRVRHPSRTDVWLDFGPDGDWTASSPPTEAAQDLLDLYLPLTSSPDLVIGQLGQSLDGRIATASGDSHFVTGPADIRRLHRLRALVDAVVVGAGTVALDDPRLTVREVEGANPVRVVLDPEDRLGRDRRVFSDGGAATIVVRRMDAVHAGPVSEAPPGGSGAAAEGTPRARLEVIALASEESEGYDPAAVLGALRARGLRRVLVEGGGVTVSRFLQAGLLDRLHVTVAPLLIGSGRPALTLPPIESLAEALRPRCRHVHLGEDLLFDLDLR